MFQTKEMNKMPRLTRFSQTMHCTQIPSLQVPKNIIQIYKSLKQTIKQVKWTTKAKQGEYIFFLLLLCTYRDLRAKMHRDKNSLLALEKPADWTYKFFSKVKNDISTLCLDEEYEPNSLFFASFERHL